MSRSREEQEALAADAIRQRMLEQDYVLFLQQEGLARGLDSAHQFAIRNRGGISCNGRTERQIIEALGIDPGPYW